MTLPYSLLTDRYELTMLDCALDSGQASKQAVFEVFTRSLPKGRPYGVVAGTSRVLEAIANFRFRDDEIQWLQDNQIVSPEAIQYLADFRFSGNAWGYLEGDLYFAHSPVLTIEAPLAEALVLETVILSILNHDSAVATATARMVDAAEGRAIYEGGSRRTHEQAGVAAARAAYLAGAAATSNLEAGRLYGVPTVGTIGHTFVLAHESEQAAFAAQFKKLGANSTYLVDTYNTDQGVSNALAVAGTDVSAIRIDSGNLDTEAKHARDLLDQAGATNTTITVSGDLDEFSIHNLLHAPIDAYLVGTSLVSGSGHPTATMVYKLVAIEGATGDLTSVAKSSPLKQTIGGRKAAFRTYDADGNVEGETLIIDTERDLTEVTGPGRRLQVPLISDGHVVGQPSLRASRSWCKTSRDELPPEARTTQSTFSFDTTMLCHHYNLRPLPKRSASTARTVTAQDACPPDDIADVVAAPPKPAARTNGSTHTPEANEADHESPLGLASVAEPGLFDESLL